MTKFDINFDVRSSMHTLNITFITSQHYADRWSSLNEITNPRATTDTHKEWDLSPTRETSWTWGSAEVKWCKHEGTYLAGYANEGVRFNDLATAQRSCANNSRCNGITEVD